MVFLLEEFELVPVSRRPECKYTSLKILQSNAKQAVSEKINLILSRRLIRF